MPRWYSCDVVSHRTDLPDLRCCHHLHFAIPALKVFRNPIYATHRDQRCTGVHRPNHLAQTRRQEVCALSSPVPDDKDDQVSGESARLQDQRNLDQNLACHVFGSAVRGVRRFGCAIGDHDLDQEVYADEGCQDTSRMQR